MEATLPKKMENGSNFTWIDYKDMHKGEKVLKAQSEGLLYAFFNSKIAIHSQLFSNYSHPSFQNKTVHPQKTAAESFGSTELKQASAELRITISILLPALSVEEETNREAN